MTKDINSIAVNTDSPNKPKIPHRMICILVGIWAGLFC